MTRRPLTRLVDLRLRLSRLVASTLGLWLAACGHGAGDAPLANQNRARAQSGVRAVDWGNRSYTLDGLGEIAIKDGRVDFAINDDGKIGAAGDTPGSFRIEPPLFADVDGDGAEDAVIASAVTTGGTGQFSQVMVFTVRAGKVVEIGGIPGGDRGDGGIRRVAVDGNAVIVQRNVLAGGDGACCASTWRRERWVWRDGALAEDVAARSAVHPVPQ